MSGTESFFITGCASGIGQHLADVLIARGHQVAATDLEIGRLEAHARERGWPEGRVLVRKLDVRDAQQWDQVFSEAVAAFGKIDFLLNVAGLVRPGWSHEMTPEMVHLHFDVNAKGVVFGTQVAARHMLERGQGHIVNVASMAALAPIPGLSVYSASKYAVRAFTLAAAQELRPRGVYATVLCPDAVQTPMLDLQKSHEEAALTFSGPRFLSVEEVAGVILNRIIPDKPLQVFLPASRGWLARLADLFPRFALALGPAFRKRGLARQSALKGGSS